MILPVKLFNLRKNIFQLFENYVFINYVENYILYKTKKKNFIIDIILHGLNQKFFQLDRERERETNDQQLW